MNIQALPKARQMTQERLREVLHYNPETGVFNWRKQRPGCVPGREVGTITNGYRQIQIDYKLFRACRLAWRYTTGSWPDCLVDHINGIRDDDRWCNLRAATYEENARNKSLCPRNTSGKVGVYQIKANGKWGAEIGINGSNIKLGCYEVKVDAVAARCEAEKHYFGVFARRHQK
jgi:hypothetical protein